MSYLKYEQEVIRQRSEKIPVSEWVLDERGRLIAFSNDIGAKVNGISKKISDAIDQMAKEALGIK